MDSQFESLVYGGKPKCSGTHICKNLFCTNPATSHGYCGAHILEYYAGKRAKVSGFKCQELINKKTNNDLSFRGGMVADAHECTWCGMPSNLTSMQYFWREVPEAHDKIAVSILCFDCAWEARAMPNYAKYGPPGKRVSKVRCGFDAELDV